MDLGKTLVVVWILEGVDLKQGIVGLILLGILACTGCETSTVPVSAAAPPTAKNTPPPSAPVAEDRFVASGPIVVENQIDVAALRDGVIAQLYTDTGSLVRKGQALARLDDRQLTADRDAASAHAASIESDLKNWEATVKMAEVDLDRSEKMFDSKLITASQVEHDRFKLTATKFELERERKNYQRAQEVLKSLDLELEKTRIVAPFDGVVARRYIRNGQRVSNGERLFWVTATAPIRVRFTVPEKYANSVRKGTLVEITPADLPAEKHSGRVILVSPVVDPGSGTFEVTAEFTGSTQGLRPGMVTNIHPQSER